MKLTKQDLMRLPKERLAEIIVEMQEKEMTLIPTPSITPTPSYRPYCWEPGGHCTNPQMDCINCPKYNSTIPYVYTGPHINTYITGDTTGTSTAKVEGQGMTYGEFKKLDYNDNLEMEIVLSEAFYKHQINFQAATNAYTYALEKEKHRQSSLFNEASTIITMWLSDNWKKPKDKTSLFKRAIHIFNLNKTFPSNIFDEQYGYTDEDKKKWDDWMKLHYGIECREDEK